MGTESVPKKQTPIAKESAKRKVLNNEYSKVSKPLWKGKDCKVKSPECSGKAEGMHHLEGKENKEKLLNTKKMIPACNRCNTYIETHHTWAVSQGLKLKRNTKTSKQPIVKNENRR
jgi:hypothetical protein